MNRVLLMLMIMMASWPLVASETAKRPNIILIQADDLGHSDVGFNGAEFYETPNLDRICRSGMKFNRAYSGGPNCAPTRACLVSGMYSPRHQIWTPGGSSKGDARYMKLHVPVRMPKKVKGPDGFPSKIVLDSEVISLAEVLSEAGYRTARLGKWHLGADNQGFHVSDQNGKGDSSTKNYYGNIDVHEWLTDASVDFINHNKDQPFFLYLNHWDVHTPIRARKEVKDRYSKKLSSKEWSRKWNTTYAAMIEAVDVSVGRIHKTLEELKLAEDTLLIFTSDNGGVSFVTTNHPLRGAKGSFYEGGVRVPTFMVWPGKIHAGSECNTPITSVDYMPTFAELAKAELPQKQPVDGASIVPLLSGKKLPERSIFWHYPLYLKGQSKEGMVHPISGSDEMYWRGVPSSMLVKGDWKLIHRFEDDERLLYNLSNDSSELKECGEVHPKVLSELSQELSAWQKETNALIPMVPNPLFTGFSKGKE